MAHFSGWRKQLISSIYLLLATDPIREYWCIDKWANSFLLNDKLIFFYFYCKTQRCVCRKQFVNWQDLPSPDGQISLWTALLSTGFRFFSRNVPLICPQTRHQSIASCLDDMVSVQCVVCISTRSVELLFASVVLLPQVIIVFHYVLRQPLFQALIIVNHRQGLSMAGRVHVGQQKGRSRCFLVSRLFEKKNL